MPNVYPSVKSLSLSTLSICWKWRQYKFLIQTKYCVFLFPFLGLFLCIPSQLMPESRASQPTWQPKRCLKSHFKPCFCLKPGIKQNDKDPSAYKPKQVVKVRKRYNCRYVDDKVSMGQETLSSKTGLQHGKTRKQQWTMNLQRWTRIKLSPTEYGSVYILYCLDRAAYGSTGQSMAEKKTN